MQAIWNTIGAVVVTALVLYWGVELMRPYVVYVLLALPIVLIGRHLYRRQRYW